MPRPHNLTLFPYTTLFRSRNRALEMRDHHGSRADLGAFRPHEGRDAVDRLAFGINHNRSAARVIAVKAQTSIDVDLRRSEEHTSELQSQSNLVCRLLLEKN